MRYMYGGWRVRLHADTPNHRPKMQNHENIGGQLWIQKQLSIGPNMNRQIHYNEAFINIATGHKNGYDGSGVIRHGIPGIIIGGNMGRDGNDNAEVSFKIGGSDGKGPGASNAILH